MLPLLLLWPLLVRLAIPIRLTFSQEDAMVDASKDMASSNRMLRFSCDSKEGGGLLFLLLLLLLLLLFFGLRRRFGVPVSGR